MQAEVFSRRCGRQNKNMVSATTETDPDPRSDGEPGTSSSPLLCLTSVCPEERDLILRGDPLCVIFKSHRQENRCLQMDQGAKAAEENFLGGNN